MRFYASGQTIEHIVVHLNTTFNSAVFNPIAITGRNFLPSIVERVSTNQLAVFVPQYSPLIGRLVAPDNDNSGTNSVAGANYPYSSNVILQKGNMVNATANFAGAMSRQGADDY